MNYRRICLVFLVLSESPPFSASVKWYSVA